MTERHHHLFVILDSRLHVKNIQVDDRVSSPSFCNPRFKVACQEHSGKFDHLACGVFELGVGN